VTISAFETLNKDSIRDAPNSHAFVKWSRSNVLRVRRDGNGSHTVFNGQSQGVYALLDIPQANGAVSTSRRNGSAVLGEVERVDVLFMAAELVANRPVLNIPHLQCKSAIMAQWFHS
jgi:hypothetical protein